MNPSIENPFSEFVDLASSRLGGKAVWTNDDFFAPMENLVKPEKPVFIADKYTDRGKWMDGWESRRRRTPGHDWCVVRLGLPGIVRGFDVDTSFFTGNYPDSCSIEAAHVARGAFKSELRALEDAVWTTVLPQTKLKGDSRNFLPAVDDPRVWTHLRLNIFPDGGVARLRVYGEAVPDWTKLAAKRKPVDLAAVENGGRALGSSDKHYGAPHNMLMPGRAANMGDGWETKRRRGPGYDWAVIRLGTAGEIERIEVDTNHFKGNYPDTCSIEACRVDGDPGPDTPWAELLPKTKLWAHQRHLFGKELKKVGPATHLRLNIFPDGGVSRLRVYGRPVSS